MEKLAKEHKPKLIVAGASSYPRIIDFERIRYIADLVGAKVMVDIAHIAGLVSVGLHPSPVPYADIVTSTTHKTFRGPRGGFVLCRKEYGAALDSAVFPGLQGGPLMHVIAAKAVSFYEAVQPAFTEYQKRVLDNAQTLAAELKRSGLRLVSGGTDNHLVMVDLTSTGVTGIEAEEALGRVNIVVNRNSIPYEPRSARITSGIRLGAPAVSSRGFGKEEMKFIAAAIVQVIANRGNAEFEETTRQDVLKVCSRFPVPGIDI